MEKYPERYDHILANVWLPFISKTIRDIPNIDCGLYCEEYSWCDFFVHNYHSRSQPCYLGTFRQVVNHTDHLETRLAGMTYFVDKSKSYFTKCLSSM